MLWIDHIAGHYELTLNTARPTTSTPGGARHRPVAAPRAPRMTERPPASTSTASQVASSAVHRQRRRLEHLADRRLRRDAVRLLRRRHRRRAHLRPGADRGRGPVGHDHARRARHDAARRRRPRSLKTGATGTTIATSWTPSTDNIGVAGYRAVPGRTQVDDHDRHVVHVHGAHLRHSTTLGVEAFDAAGNVVVAHAADREQPAPATRRRRRSRSRRPPAANGHRHGAVSATAARQRQRRGRPVQARREQPRQPRTRAAPYSFDWDTRGGGPAPHADRGRARRLGQHETSSPRGHRRRRGAAAGSGPVAAYSFDDGAGTIAGDATGNGNKAPSWAPRGRPGSSASALELQRVSSRVDLPPLGTFYKTGFTLEAWVKQSDAEERRRHRRHAGTATSGGPMMWVDYLAGRYFLTLERRLRNYLDSGAARPPSASGSTSRPPTTAPPRASSSTGRRSRAGRSRQRRRLQHLADRRLRRDRRRVLRRPDRRGPDLRPCADARRRSRPT